MKLANSPWDIVDMQQTPSPSTPSHTMVSSDLLSAWLDDDRHPPATLDEIWGDLQHARQALELVADKDFSHALADLYCAAYSWHLACTSPSLSKEARHRQAATSAMDEVRTVERLSPSEESEPFMFRWCS